MNQYPPFDIGAVGNEHRAPTMVSLAPDERHAEFGRLDDMQGRTVRHLSEVLRGAEKTVDDALLMFNDDHLLLEQVIEGWHSVIRDPVFNPGPSVIRPLSAVLGKCFPGRDVVCPVPGLIDSLNPPDEEVRCPRWTNLGSCVCGTDRTEYAHHRLHMLGPGKVS